MRQAVAYAVAGLMVLLVGLWPGSTRLRVDLEIVDPTLRVVSQPAYALEVVVPARALIVGQGPGKLEVDLRQARLWGDNGKLQEALEVRCSGFYPAVLEQGAVLSAPRPAATVTLTPWGWLRYKGLALLCLPLLAGAAIQVRRVGRARQEAEVAQVEEQIIRPGGLLEGYRLEELLGQGSQAEVYRARRVKGEANPVVVKVLLPGIGSEDSEAHARFEREAHMCENLDHPHVVRVHQWGFTQGRWWMVQDCLTGGTLRGRLTGPLPEAEVKRLMREIAEGLAYAHRRGIVHRDLKPDNVLLDGQGHAVIADFGMARSGRYQTITKTDATLGTPAYMPPEQVKGERPDPRADLYSLGVMAYEMLKGEIPFQGDAIQVMMAHMMQTPPALPEEVSPALGELVLKLLSKEPADRVQSAAEVVKLLQGG